MLLGDLVSGDGNISNLLSLYFGADKNKKHNYKTSYMLYGIRHSGKKGRIRIYPCISY